MRQIRSERQTAKLRGSFVGLLLGASAGMAYAATSYDVLVNAETYVADGSTGGLNADNGPVGGAFTYRAKVKINGQSGTLSNVELTQTLPTGAIFQGVSGPAGVTCTEPGAGTTITAFNAKIVCTLPSISAADFVSVDFKVVLPSESTEWKAYASTAAVAGNTDTDGDNNNNIDRNITTYPRADLAVAITAPTDGGTVTQGDVVNYKVVVSNANSAYASDLTAGQKAVLRFNQPQGTTFSSMPSNTDWTCTAKLDSSTSPATNYQECIYTVPTGQSITKGSDLPELTFPVVVNVAGGQVPAQASIVGQDSASKPFTESVWDNNTDENLVNVNPNLNMDMAVTKSVDKLTLDQDAGANVPLIYTLKVNRVSGQIDPASITVTDTLPAGVSFVSVGTASTNWRCTPSGQVLTCTYSGSMALGTNPGYTQDLVINATVAQSALTTGATFTNKAVLAVPNETDPNGANNTTTVTSNVKDNVNLKVTKTATESVVASGQPYSYEIAVKNNGPLDVRDGQTITITDDLDDRLEFVSVDSPWSCTPSGGTITGTPPVTLGQMLNCTYSGGIANGETSTLKLNVKPHLNGNLFAQITNVANLTGVTGRDPITAIANSPAINLSELKADLSITKSGAVTAGTSTYGDGASGSEVVWTLTVKNTNPGGAASVQEAKTVEITDTVNNLINTARATPAGVSLYTESGRYLMAEVTLPSGSTATADACTYSNTTNNAPDNTKTSSTVKCVLHNVPVGDDAYIVTIKARQYVDPSRTSSTVPVNNTGNVSSPDTAEYNSDNNKFPASVALTALADMTVTKVADPTTAAAGQDIGYTLTARNNGPSSARAVKVEDTLPVGAIWVSKPAITGGTCTLGDGTTQTAAINIGDPVTAPNNHLVCTWTSALALNNQYVAAYHLRSVTQNAPAELKNAVHVSTSTPERDDKNNDANATVTLGAAQVDVLVNMKHTNDGIPLTTGETQYTITVTNNGASNSYATGVTMTENFFVTGSGAKFSFESLDSITSSDNTHVFDLSACTVPAVGATAGQLVCKFPWLKPGEAVDIKFTMKPTEILDGKPTGTIYHSASVIADVEQMSNVDVTANNQTMDRTSTYDPAQVTNPDELKYIDLSITKDTTVPAEGVAVGDVITYTLVVKNEEDPTATPPLNLVNGNAVLTDTLPVGLELVTIPNGCGYNDVSHTVNCEIVNLDAGKSLTYNLSVKVTQVAPGQTTIVNTAKVTSLGDPKEPNNESSKEVPVKETAFDLSLAKSVDKAQTQAGDTLTYTLVVTNHGPAQSKVGQISDQLPAGLTFVSASTGCTGADTAVSCSVNALDKDAVKTFTITAVVADTVTGPTTLTNTATVAADGDTNPDNNQDTAEVTVQGFDLALLKSVDKAQTKPGDKLIYTLVVTNHGPAQSKAGQISDPLPAGLTFASASAGCAAAGTTVSCSVNALAKDAAQTFTITVLVADTVTGPTTLSNTATVTAEGDQNPGNNESSAETLVPGPSTPTPVPTLTQWGQVLMAALLAVLGLAVLRRRHG